MDLESIEVLVLLGGVAGFASGVGGGGGPFSVALLILVLPTIGVTGSDLGRIAAATSVALIVPMTIRSVTAHVSRGSVDWRLFRLFGPSLAVGTMVAAIAAPRIHPALLAAAFAVSAVIAAWRLFASGHTQMGSPVRAAPLALRGVLGGAFTALLGTGVGVVAIPTMARLVPMARAVGTNAMLALPVAIVGTISYLAAPKGCAACVGYVYVPAVAAMGLSAVLAVPFGVWAAHIIPESAMRALLAATLLMAAGNLLYRSVDAAALGHEARRVITSIQMTFEGAGTPVAGGVPAWLHGGEQ